MGFFQHLTPGRIAGWMMLAFVAAIGAHSLFPYFHSKDVLLFALILGSIFPIVFLRSRLWIAMLLLIASATFGWWRFERAPTPKLRRIGDHQLIIKSPDETSVFARLRRTLSSRVASVLPSEDANLVTGILYGDQDLTTGQSKRFRSAGLMHLVAVSGSNVTIVVQVIVLVAASLKLHRRHRFYATSLILVLFALFVGCSASVVRAAFMAWLVLGSREVGRLAIPTRLLLVAATVQLLWNPWQLLFDASFALSFLAMWGILVWVPIFERWFHWIPKRFDVRTTVSMTLAATLATAPYQAWAFGKLTLAGLFTNVLALPLVPFVMGWGAATAAWGTLPFHAVVSEPTRGLVHAINFIASLAEKTPWLQFVINDLSFPCLVAIYAVLVYFAAQLTRKNELSTEKQGE